MNTAKQCFTKNKLKTIAKIIAENPRKWMEMLNNACPKWNTLRLNQIIIPGVHDAGTGYMNITSYYINGYEFLSKIIKKMIHSITQTQKYGLYDMLCNGARALDCRPFFNSNQEIVYNHGPVVINFSFKQSLLEIKKFIDENPNEIIIMDIGHFESNMTLTQQSFKHLGKIISDTLEKYIFKFSDNIIELPLNKLIGRKNIIIFFDTNSRTQVNWLKKYTYPESSYNNYYESLQYNNNNIVKKLAKSWNDLILYYIPYYAPLKNKKTIKNLQFHEQVDIMYIIKSFIPFNNNLEYGSYILQQDIINWITKKDNIINNHINIIQVNYYNQDLLYGFILANLLRCNQLTPYKHEMITMPINFYIKKSTILWLLCIILFIIYKIRLNTKIK